MPASTARQQKLYQELRLALARTNGDDWKTWGSDSAALLPRIAARRVKNLGGLAVRLAKATGKELAEFYSAWRQGNFGAHLGNRSATGIDGSIELVEGISNAVISLGKALFADPKKNVPDVFALALGFYTGSGGFDGNGGIPDSDLALGIDWHRSVFTHSIIAGIVVEGAILAIADLSGVVCAKLSPSERDPFWDRLVETKSRIATSLVMGTSAGIAYHLAADATLQPAPYHDWPFSMSLEEHQAIMAANAVAEGLDILHKEDTTGQKVVTGIKATGGAMAKGAAVGAGLAWSIGKGFLSGLRGDGK